MTVVALYPLDDAPLDDVRTWWTNEVPRLRQNGANSVFSPLARAVLVIPLATGLVVAVHFDSAEDARNGDQDLQRFWQEHGVGQLRSPSIAASTYGPDPNAMMVWCTPKKP
jgi:hypothetical protein